MYSTPSCYIILAHVPRSKIESMAFAAFHTSPGPLYLSTILMLLGTLRTQGRILGMQGEVLYEEELVQ